MAHALGFRDEYYRGWLLATINLSDLAAAGAEPLGLLTSLQLPAATPIREFERLLDGLDECCAAQGTTVVGGNLKEASFVDVSATALGWCDSPPLTRSGASVGDLVGVIGELGAFWAGSLAVERGLIEPDPEHPLLRNPLTPPPQLAVGRELRRRALATACIDNSDGLYPSLLQLGAASNVGIAVVEASIAYSVEVAEMAERLKVEPLRLALGWGDWQLVITCSAEAWGDIDALAAELGSRATVLGVATEEPGVRLRDSSGEGSLLPLDSQRFAPDSWFSAGLDRYVEMMLSDPLRQPL